MFDSVEKVQHWNICTCNGWLYIGFVKFGCCVSIRENTHTHARTHASTRGQTDRERKGEINTDTHTHVRRERERGIDREIHTGSK